MDSEYFIAFALFLLLIGLPLYVMGLLIVLPCIVILSSLHMAIRQFRNDERELWYINRRAQDVVEEAREIVRDRTSGATA